MPPSPRILHLGWAFSGLQAMIHDRLDPSRRRALTDTLLAADADTAATSRAVGALLRQDGHAFLLAASDESIPSRTIPGYVRAALEVLPEENRAGLCGSRLSAHERLVFGIHR
jgi:hypothetical protein